MAAFLEARRLQCNALQIFPRSPGTPLRFLSKSELQEIARFRKLHSISPLIIHSVYQPNIASTHPKIYAHSRDSLLEEFQFAHSLGAEFLVIHSGNYSPDSNRIAGLKKSARTIRWALEKISSPTKILIENVPGGGRRMGGTFEELRELLDAIGLEKRTGICFDTAHAFAAGYPIQTVTGMEKCISELEKKIGLRSLELFHINDTAAEFASHKDIHQHIGEGQIGLEPLQWLIKEKRFEKKPGILETPKAPLGSDAANLGKFK